jgi:protein-disulfide isomerase
MMIGHSRREGATMRRIVLFLGLRLPAFPLALVVAPLLALPLALGLPMHPAAAQTAGFTPAQRAEIVGIVRQALVADPSILRDAIQSLQADDARAQAASAQQTIADEHRTLLADPNDQTLGNPKGDVTVVVFYDPRCPFCRRMMPVFSQLLQSDARVRLVLKDLPILGPASVLETRAMLAAEKQGGYLKLMSALMAAPPDATEASIAAAAQKVGLNVPELQKDMQDPAIGARIDANMALARKLGLEGTPMMVVGGQVIQGAVELSDLQASVAAARKG